MTIAYASVRLMIRSMLIQPVPEDPRTPMHTGAAAKPSTKTSPTACQMPCALDSGSAVNTVTKLTSVPLANHFSCCRRSPDDRRQETT